MANLINISRSCALVVTFAIGIQGCATTPTTRSCEQFGDTHEQLDCFDRSMFNRVTNGVLIGAVGGAILGGAVAFVLTKNPAGALVATAKGAFVGTMVGGVAGGVVAYFDDLQQRSGGRQEIMIENHIASMEADSRRYETLVRIAIEVSQKEKQLYADIKHKSNEQEAELISLKESVQQIKLDNTDYKNSHKVHNEASANLGIQTVPRVVANNIKTEQQIEKVDDIIVTANQIEFLNEHPEFEHPELRQ